MTIAFIHSYKSFLPEIGAYQKFFNKYGIDTSVIDLKNKDAIDADVEWHFMGLSHTGKKKKSIIVHEYASASVPPFNRQKDLLKRLYNGQPGYRIFLNEYVKQTFNFKDSVPSGLRNMGVDDLFFHHVNRKKEYDFIYTGSVAPERKIEKLLQCFTRGDLQNHSLLILSKDYDAIASRFSSSRNIQFTGPVDHETVAEYISRASFCINYIPDGAPFNQQTPVKFLEYLASNIPVISTRNAWTEKFSQEYGGDYFFLDETLSNFTWENVNRHNYSFPDMRKWTWEYQIRKSGVLEFLQSKFKEVQF